MEELLISIVGAAAAGAAFGIVSYFKNKKQKDYLKDFSTTNFVVSVAGAAVIGGLASYWGLTPDVVSSSAVGPLVYQSLRKLLHGIFPN